MKTHELKTWCEPFAAIIDGNKRHEVRRFDREFAIGDLLLLREWDHRRQEYTGREATVEVTYLTEPGTWGLPLGVGVLSILLLASRQSSDASPDIASSR